MKSCIPRKSRLIARWAEGALLMIALLYPLCSFPGEPLVRVSSGGGLLGEVYEINPLYEPTESFDQESTPTCFAHVATFALQFLLNSQTRVGSSSSSISAIDVLGQGSLHTFPEEGTAFSLLHHLKGRSIWKVPRFSIDDVWEFKSKLVEFFKLKPKTSVSELISKSLPLNIKRVHEDWKQRLSAFSGHYKSLSDPKLAIHQISYSYLNQLITDERVPLPQYNLHVFDPSSSDLKAILPSEVLSAEEAMIFIIRAWFKSYGSNAFPLEVGYCEEVDEHSGGCNFGSLHAVNLVGVGHSCDDSGNCSDSWRIRNSNGIGEEGWFEALPLARAILMAKTSVSYIFPCREETHSVWAGRDSGELAPLVNRDEACSTGILGLQFGPERDAQLESALAKSLAPYRAAYPLHSLVLAGDESEFFKAVTRLEATGDLASHLRRTDERGRPLGHVAVKSNSLRILEWLSAQAPETLRMMNGLGCAGNSAHQAAALGRTQAAKTLLAKHSELFAMKNPCGDRPLDFAAFLGNQELLYEVSLVQPELLKLPSADGRTPLQIFEEKFPDTYPSLKKRLEPKMSRIAKFCELLGF